MHQDPEVGPLTSHCPFSTPPFLKQQKIVPSVKSLFFTLFKEATSDLDQTNSYSECAFVLK